MATLTKVARIGLFPGGRVTRIAQIVAFAGLYTRLDDDGAEDTTSAALGAAFFSIPVAYGVAMVMAVAAWNVVEPARSLWELRQLIKYAATGEAGADLLRSLS